MKNIRLVRHGQSAANAGAASHDHATIPLTEKGRQQARDIALSITQAPDLIIASPFLRAQDTAAAIISRFPCVPVETWPIEEFTYLEPARCVDTTVAQRKRWVDRYWADADPAYVDGEGAESFLQFAARAESFLDRLAAHPAQAVLVFSHGQFLSLVAWLIERPPAPIDSLAMREWRRYEIDNHLANGASYRISRTSDDSGWETHHPRKSFIDRNPKEKAVEAGFAALARNNYQSDRPDPADNIFAVVERLSKKGD